MDDLEYMEHKQYAFEVYCKVILRNRARNIHSRLNQKRKHEVCLDELASEQWIKASVEDGYDLATGVVLDHLGNQYSIDEDLAAALSILLPKYREIIIRAYFLDSSDTEIAEQLGIPLSTVNERKKSALRRLREKLRNKNE